MFTSESYDPYFFIRVRHEHPQLHPNHIGLIRLAHAASFDDLEEIDRELEILTARRRQVLDRLSEYRRRMWPRMRERHQRRLCRDEENPLPPAAVDAEPAVGDVLRRVAVAIVGRHGPVSLRELHGLIHRYGYVIESARPVQRLADAMAYEVRHGRLDRVGRGVYGPVAGACHPAPGLPDREPLPWRAPASAQTHEMAEAPLADRAVDPAVRDDPERWSGRAWPESAQAGGAWCDGPVDPFVAEIAEDVATTALAARQRVAALYSERLGPPPPRRDPRRPRSSYGWARTYPPRTPKPFPADAVAPPSPRPDDPPSAPDPSNSPEPSASQTPRDAIGNDSSTNRSRWRRGRWLGRRGGARGGGRRSR